MRKEKQYCKLQKMIHVDCMNDPYTLTHVVNTNQLGGEYTICGLAISDSTIEFEGFQQKGFEFEGVVSQCTCKKCREYVNEYCKSLKINNTK